MISMNAMKDWLGVDQTQFVLIMKDHTIVHVHGAIVMQTLHSDVYLFRDYVKMEPFATKMQIVEILDTTFIDANVKLDGLEMDNSVGQSKLISIF